MYYIKHIEISSSVQWDAIIITLLVKFETKLKIDVKVTGYLMQTHIYSRIKNQSEHVLEKIWYKSENL